MSNQENTIKNDELDLSLFTIINVNLSPIVGPGQGCNFNVETGRNYNVIAKNMDDTFDLTFVVDDFSGSGYQTEIIKPHKEHSIIVSGDSGKILVLNNTYGIGGLTLGRPSASVLIHSA